MPDRSNASTKMFESQLALVLDMAYGTALHMTRHRDAAEDLVQNAAIKAFRYYHTFESGTNFKAWFFRILVNCFRQEYRKEQRAPAMTTLEDAPELYLYMRAASSGTLDSNSDPAAHILSQISREHIQQALAALPGEHRIVAVLYFVEELSYQEIADSVKCPIGTVRSRLYRARKLLQKALRQLNEEQNLMLPLKFSHKGFCGQQRIFLSPCNCTNVSR